MMRTRKDYLKIFLEEAREESGLEMLENSTIEPRKTVFYSCTDEDEPILRKYMKNSSRNFERIK